MVESASRLNNSSSAAVNNCSFSEQRNHNLEARSVGFEPDEAVRYCGEHHNVAGDVEGAPIDFEADENPTSKEILKRVELRFTDYFLGKVGPSLQTEQIRRSVSSTLD